MSETVDSDIIATFNQANALNFQIPFNASGLTIEKLMNNIRICENDSVQRSFTSMLLLSMGATKKVLKPCYDSTIGMSSDCSQFLPNSICCLKHLERNKPISELNKFFLALTEYQLNNEIIHSEKYKMYALGSIYHDIRRKKRSTFSNLKTSENHVQNALILIQK